MNLLNNNSIIDTLHGKIRVNKHIVDKPIRFGFFVVGAFIFFLTLIEFSFFLKFRKYDLFYNAPQIDELNFRLFNVLDPVLGYASNSAFSPSETEIKQNFFATPDRIKTLGNGFVTFENRSEPKPIKIVILGESTSDPYLFNGNWPWSLHEILEQKKISHVIYNGAVSGYTSSQQLYKLIRDVLYLDNPDIIIAFNGLTDVPATGDVVEGHVGVHVYQKFLFDVLSGNPPEGREPRFLPNSQFGIKQIFSKVLFQNRSFVQYGVGNVNALGTFVNNIKIMNAVCETKNISFFHFLGQIEQSPKQKDLTMYQSKIFQYSDENVASVHEFFKKSEQLLKSEKYSVSLYNVLPADEPLFVDIGHLNPTGSKIIAEKIFQNLEPVIKKLGRKQ